MDYRLLLILLVCAVFLSGCVGQNSDPSVSTTSLITTSSTMADNSCKYNSGENCRNTPSKCICKNGQICTPERAQSDNLGCYSIVCGDGFKDPGETSVTCCLDAGCLNGWVCDAILKQCVKPLCPYDCCANDAQYQDKSCPQYYTCNAIQHSCIPDDSDNDAFPDYLEIQTGTNRFSPDTDGDTVLDGYDNHPLYDYLPRTYSYEWYYGIQWWILRTHFAFNVNVSEDVVASYEKMPKDKLISRADTQLREVAQTMNQLASKEGYDDADKLMMVIAFSRSFNYDYTKRDFNKPLPDWANFPMETIVKKQGLCADSAVMATALLRDMGYDVQYLAGPCNDYSSYHAILGVPYVNGITLDGTERYVTYNGKNYYYVDATSSDSSGNLFYSTTSKDDFGNTFCTMNEFSVVANY